MCCSLPVTVCQEIPVGDDLLSRSSIHRVAVCTDLRSNGSIPTRPIDILPRVTGDSHCSFRSVACILLSSLNLSTYISLLNFPILPFRISKNSFARVLRVLLQNWIQWQFEYLDEIIRINQLLNSDREATKHSEKYEFFKTLFTWDNTGKRVYKVGNEKEDLKLKIPVVPFHSGFTIRSWSPHHSV